MPPSGSTSNNTPVGETTASTSATSTTSATATSTGTSTLPTRKRHRDDAEEPTNPPCIQCRSRKVRCDRQSPHCSNCRRAGVPCEYSNSSSSRVYTIKEVLDEFSSVTSRLDRIEEALLVITDYIKKPASAAGVLQSPPTTNGRLSGPGTHSVQGQEQEHGEDGVHEHGSGDVDDEHGVRSSQSDGCVVDCPAAFSLFRSLRRRLAADLDGSSEGPRSLWALVAQQHPGVKDGLKRHLQAFPLDGTCVVYPVTGDNQPVTVPPRAMVEECVADYLEHINAYTPIFDRDGLRDRVAFYYDSPPCQQTLAQALSISNIYLLSVTLASRVDRARLAPTRNEGDDVDTIRVLLKNCDRALHDLEAISKPGRESVESLLTLALVCHEYYPLPIYARVLQAATRIVRMMGLDQARVERPGTWESISEAERLFWVTYTLDKSLVFLSGQPGDLYFFNSSLPLRPWNNKNPTIHDLTGAFNSLATIWEDIYISLYSAQATTTGRLDRETHLIRLRIKLSAWKDCHDSLLNKPLPTHRTSIGTTELSTPQIEIQYAHQITQILIQRLDTTLPLRARYHTHASHALTLLKTFSTPHLPAASFTILSRIFRNYPMVAFHDLFLYISLSGRQALIEYAELLETARILLEPFQDLYFTESYYARLCMGFGWCMGALDLVMPMVSACNGNGSGVGVMRASMGVCPDLDVIAEHLEKGADGNGNGNGNIDGDGEGDGLIEQSLQLESGIGFSESFFDAGMFSNWV